MSDSPNLWGVTTYIPEGGPENDDLAVVVCAAALDVITLDMIDLKSQKDVQQSLSVYID